MSDLDESAPVNEALTYLAGAYDGAELSRELERFGFAELLETAERAGVSSLFLAMGRAGSSCGALNEVMAGPLRAVARELPVSRVLLPSVALALAGTMSDGVAELRGLALGEHSAGRLLAAVSSDTSGGLVVVDTHGGGTERAVTGIDPAFGLNEVSGAVPHADVVLAGTDAANAWAAALAAGRRALGYQLLGAVTEMIALATEHALQRKQFGRQIGAFQAVRHRLAEALVAREAAAAALEASWDADDQVLGAMLAKSLSGKAARIAATHCQQVLAGVGFTAEHRFHRYVHRIMVLDQLLGSSAELPQSIGAYLVGVGDVPRLVEL